METKQLLIAVFALALITLPAQRSGAAIVISKINLTDSYLSFELSGTVDNVGTYGNTQLFVGEPGNASWITSFASGTWTDKGSNYTINDAIVNSLSAGDAAILSGPAPGLVAGESVIKGVFEASGSFTASATTPSDWIVSAGYTTPDFVILPDPDPDSKTGFAVPEPSSGLFVAGLIAALAIRRRR